jgi:hypothetical protein
VNGVVLLDKNDCMYRIGCFVLCLFLVCCNNEDKPAAEAETGFDYKGFTELFPAATASFELTDSALLSIEDTITIRSTFFPPLIPDSLKSDLFGKDAKIKYGPLARVQSPKGENYFVIRAFAKNKTVALLLVFGDGGSHAAAFPFLVPDKDENTSQSSSVDKSLTISKNITKRNKGETSDEGKNVYVYNQELNSFVLIMTDVLDDKSAEVINPIDTLPATRKFAGDYKKGKRNIVSIRNGRTPAQATAFVHLETEDGNCTGELKGEILFTSSKTAIYRQGGDPCVLQFTFTSNSVTLKEEEGCGNHRGLECTLEGTLNKKKAAKTKAASAKSVQK